MTKEVVLTIKSERKVLLPTLPNFVRTVNDESIPICELSQDQLEQLGRAWTEELKRKARNRIKP